MAKLPAFIAMGGYGSYLWPCYALLLVAFLGLWLFAERNKQRALRSIAYKLKQHDVMP